MSLPAGPALLGCAVALVSGLVAARLMLRLVKNDRLEWFRIVLCACWAGGADIFWLCFTSSNRVSDYLFPLSGMKLSAGEGVENINMI